MHTITHNSESRRHFDFQSLETRFSEEPGRHTASGPALKQNKSPETRHMELTAGKCCTVLTQSHQAPTLKHHSLSRIDVCSYWPQKIQKCASAYEPVTRKNPIQQSESNLWGEARFRYSVVLANGLSELHPSSFELRLTEKYSRYFENIFPIWIRVSFHKYKHCRTEHCCFHHSCDLCTCESMQVNCLCSVKKSSGALLMPTITNADPKAKRLDYKTLTGWSCRQVLLIVFSVSVSGRGMSDIWFVWIMYIGLTSKLSFGGH